MPKVLQAVSVDDKNSVLVTGLYSYFVEKFGSVKPRQDKPQRQRLPCDRALEKVTVMKNDARRKFRDAKRKGTLPEETAILAKSFFQLVRQQSSLKKKSDKAKLAKSTKRVRRECHKNFWRFTKNLFEGDVVSNVKPAFSEKEALDYFSAMYQSEARQFEKPSWMPTLLDNRVLNTLLITSYSFSSRNC